MTIIEPRPTSAVDIPPTKTLDRPQPKAPEQARPHVDEPPILPTWLRDRETFRSTTRNFTRRNSRRALRWLWKGPELILKLLLLAPRGLWRVSVAVGKWVYDQDSAALRHEHAGRVETAEYARAQAVRKANLHARGMVVATVALMTLGPVLAWTFPSVLSAIAGVVLAAWIIKIIPGRSLTEVVVAAAAGLATWWFLPLLLERIPRPPAWSLWTIGTVVVLALGWAGRNRDKALVANTEVVAPGIVPPLRAPMVTEALCALGNSKMKDPDSIRLLMDVARQGAGYQLDLELPPAVPATFVMEQREEFAAALRRELGCVWPSVGKRHPGHLSLYVSDEPMSRATQPRWPLLAGEPVDLFAPVEMFTNHVGAWVKATFAYTAWVVGAVPRMGKTYFVRQFGLVAGLDVRAKVLAFDLKGTGDLSPLAQFTHAYSVGDEPEEVAVQLEWMRWVRAEMRRRAKLIRELSLEQNPEKGKVTSALASRAPKTYGPIVVLVDECQVWFEEFDQALPGMTGKDPGKAVREEFIAICRDLVKRGPALGVIPLFATQKPDARSIPTAIADNASARVCFKVNGQTSNDQVLGTSSYRNGIRATQFAFEDKGVAYYRGEGADAAIVRTVFGLDATTSEKLAGKARALREAAGLLTGDAAGEAVDERPQVDLLVDCRQVVGSSKAVLLDELREGLAGLRSETWGHLDNAALGSMLKAAGVKRGTVYSTALKREGYGVKAEWLNVAATADEDPGGDVVELSGRR